MCPIGAQPMGSPGWPEFAFSTASMARKRMVLIDNSTRAASVFFSRVSTLAVTTARLLLNFPSPRRGALRLRPMPSCGHDTWWWHPPPIPLPTSRSPVNDDDEAAPSCLTALLSAAKLVITDPVTAAPTPLHIPQCITAAMATKHFQRRRWRPYPSRSLHNTLFRKQQNQISINTARKRKKTIKKFSKTKTSKLKRTPKLHQIPWITILHSLSRGSNPRPHKRNLPLHDHIHSTNKKSKSKTKKSLPKTKTKSKPKLISTTTQNNFFFFCKTQNGNNKLEIRISQNVINPTNKTNKQGCYILAL